MVADFRNREWFVSKNDYELLPELKSNSSDLFLIGVSANKVLYSKPVNDLLFAAHNPVTVPGNYGVNVTTYRADRTSQAMGCWQQVG